MEGLVYVTDSIALGAMQYLMRTGRGELAKAFPSSFWRMAFRSADNVQGQAETEALCRALREAALFAEPLGEGGILNALWEMGEKLESGLDIDMKRIPIRQETVEILEYFDINPYYALSSGSLLLAIDPARLPEAEEICAASGAALTRIGRLTPPPARILRRGETTRYLDRPQREELYKMAGYPGSAMPEGGT